MTNEKVNIFEIKDGSIKPVDSKNNQVLTARGTCFSVTKKLKHHKTKVNSNLLQACKGSRVHGNENSGMILLHQKQVFDLMITYSNKSLAPPSFAPSPGDFAPPGCA